MDQIDAFGGSVEKRRGHCSAGRANVGRGKCDGARRQRQSVVGLNGHNEPVVAFLRNATGAGGLIGVGDRQIGCVGRTDDQELAAARELDSARNGRTRCCTEVGRDQQRIAAGLRRIDQTEDCIDVCCGESSRLQVVLDRIARTGAASEGNLSVGGNRDFVCCSL